MEEIKSINNYIVDDDLDLEKLVADYSSYIYTIIKNMVGNILANEDIEEMISDVLFAVWKNRDIIKEGMPLKPYIVGITRNIVKNRIRKINNNIVLFIDDENINFDVRDVLDIERIIQTNEEIRAIEKILEELGEEAKNIFKMFYFYGMKAKEIAKKLGLTEDNVNIKLHRTREKIKARVKSV